TTLWSAKTLTWWRAVERMLSVTSRATVARSVRHREMERRPASRQETSNSVVSSSARRSACVTINAASAPRALRSWSPEDRRRWRSSAWPLITARGVFISCQAILKMSSRSRSRWGCPVQSHDGAPCVNDDKGVVHGREDGLQLQSASFVLQGHLLRRANTYDDGSRLRGDGAQTEEILIFVGFGPIALCREHPEHPIAG